MQNGHNNRRGLTSSVEVREMKKFHCMKLGEEEAQPDLGDYCLMRVSERSIEGKQEGSQADRRHARELQVPGEWTRDSA
jgi:hypothetical protein